MFRDLLVTLAVAASWTILMVLVLTMLVLHSLWIPVVAVFGVQGLFGWFLPNIVEFFGYEYGTD